MSHKCLTEGSNRSWRVSWQHAEVWIWLLQGIYGEALKEVPQTWPPTGIITKGTSQAWATQQSSNRATDYSQTQTKQYTETKRWLPAQTHCRDQTPIKHFLCFHLNDLKTPLSSLKQSKRARAREENDIRCCSEAVISGKCGPLAEGGVFTEHLLLCISRLPAITRDKLKRLKKSFSPGVVSPLHHTSNNQYSCHRSVCGASHEYTEIHFYTH